MSRKDWDIFDWKYRCSELAFEVKRLQKDSERLEWLAKAEVFPMNTKEGWCLSGDGVTCWTNIYDTWRDAIDEAMADALTVREKVNPECTK